KFWRAGIPPAEPPIATITGPLSASFPRPCSARFLFPAVMSNPHNLRISLILSFSSGSRSCAGIRFRADNRQSIESCNDAVAFARGGLKRLAISDCDLAATVFDSPALLQLLRKQGYRRSPESEHFRYLLLRQQ